MRHYRIFVLAAVLATAVGPLHADELADVIAKHIDARGGADAWADVHSMKITGTYTAFSKEAPFTLYRARPDLYLLQTEFNENKAWYGHDGHDAWMDFGMFFEGSQTLTGAELSKQRREFLFGNPLLDLEGLGYTAKLVGEAEYDDMPVVAIELTAPDGMQETWYLDPETWLDVGRVSPGSDFGRPMDQRTVFDDFRQVGDIVVPFFQESQWYTRDHILEVDEIVLNPELDDAMFAMPAPLGMGAYQAMVGEWDVHEEMWAQPGADVVEGNRTATITARMRGGLLEEAYVSTRGNAILRTLSYDRYRSQYRLTEMDEVSTHLDVQQGTLDDNGKLVLSNVDTNTPANQFGQTFHGRISIVDVTEDGFRIEEEISNDGGENWFLQRASTYTRRSDG